MADALTGIRIIDLTAGVAGRLGLSLLAPHGADVVQADAFHPTADVADVVVESTPRVDFDALHAASPTTILVSCPAYPAGHRLAGRPGWDALVQASSGLMWEQPGWRTGPIFLHLPIPSVTASWLIATGVLAALSERERTGHGQHVQTSLFQGALLATTQLWQEVEHGGRSYHEIMAKTYPPGIHQAMAYECAAGEWLHLSIISGLSPLRTVDDVVGLAGLVSDADRRARFKTWDRAHLIEALRDANHAVEAIAPTGAILEHPQTIANGGMSIHLGEPAAVRGPGRAAQVASVGGPEGAAQVASVSDAGRAAQVASVGDAGRAAQVASVGGAERAEQVASAGDAGRAARVASPLDGIRVLDFGQYLAGPFGPMILADLGADVIKIEPVTGDNMRGTAKAFIGCQRGKRSLALDLKDPAGLDVARRLIADADIVHHNMTRGVATRLGIDYAACRDLRPDIIYCNTYAYGPDGPLGRFGGLDPIFQASAGIEYEAGAVPEGGAPLYLRFGLCDTANAMLSVIGVLLALVHRDRTGEGRELWTSLHDAGAYMAAASTGLPHLDAGQHGLGARYRLYRTQGDGWICVAAVSDAQWKRLLDTTGVGGDDLEGAFLTRTARLWHLALDDAGVPNELPLDSDEGTAVLHDDDNVRLGLVMDHDHPVLGHLRQFGKLLSCTATPSPPPMVGQHSRSILQAAGYRDGDIDALIGRGVVYEPDADYRWTT